MNYYQVVDTVTGGVVMNFQSKTDVTARARARRECKILASEHLELRKHIAPATWKALGPVHGREVA